MKQNDTYTAATDESCNYAAKCNNIETKPSEAYAMSITTEKNEAYTNQL